VLGVPANVQQTFVQVACGDRSVTSIAVLRALLWPAPAHTASTAIANRSSRERLPVPEPLTRTIKPASLGHAISFVGRTKELEEVTARLADPACRLLTIIGLGGSGKTRLAIEAANSITLQFPHGIVFVALQPLTRSDLLVSTIAQAVGLTFYGEGEPHEQLLDYLRDKILLLILDNFEHVLDRVELVSTILASAPGAKILATSREALSLREEWLYPLHGLATPLSVYATSFEDYEAVQLFLSHARRVQPHFDKVNEHESIIRICMMTAGLPLAIELAASWLKGLSVTHIAQEIQRNLDFLSTTTRNIEERHRSMRAVFDQSWTFLSDNERLIFSRLSVFAGGFDRDAAEQVANASFSSLASLVEKSLVQMDSAGRFRMHELLRQYGMEQLEAYGEIEATYARHSRHFAQLMLKHEAALKQPQQLEIVRAIERDFDDIRLAWEWSAKNQQITHLHAMLNGLYLFGFLRSRYRETIAIFQQTLEQSVADTPLLGRLLARRWGYLHWWYLADYQQALTSTKQALTISLGENNTFEIAFCHLMAAYALMRMQRYAEALPHVETSHALFEEIDEPFYVCWVLHRLGYVYYNLNNTGKWIEYTEQSLSLARVTHDRFALVTCLYTLGSVYILNGDYIKGQQYCAEALQFATESEHRGQIAHALSLLALCAFCQGEYTICQDYAEHSQAIIEDINFLVVQAYNLSLLILLACLREDYAEALQLAELAKRHSTNRLGFQLLYWALAVLACGVGSPTDVRMYIQNVLQRSDPDVHSVTTIWIVPCTAYALAATDPAAAVEVLAWVYASADTALQWVRQWPLSERMQAQLQAVMDRDSYQIHWEMGKELSFDAIQSYLYQELSAASIAVASPAQQQILTAREREILGLMAAGMTNSQIAAQLVISTGTVKTHALTIYRKLEVANRTQALLRAQELGLLQA
jgi:predicted ATPase/DNA-binding CsgD family transcriptional regulator